MDDKHNFNDGRDICAQCTKPANLSESIDTPGYKPKRSNEMDWLEVEKELPKDNKDKIVYSASRGVGFAWINSLKNQWFFHDIGAVGRGYYLKDITHWMPLPKPPTD